MRLRKEIYTFFADESGVGVIEIVLILVGNCITNKLRVLCVCCRQIYTNMT